MSLRQRRVPALLGLIALLAGLAAAGASIALVFVDESRDLRVTLCAIIAAAVAIITLVSAPAAKPYPALAGRRRPGVARFGRLLVRVCWLLRVGVAGTAAWFITWNSGSAAIQPLAAALVALSMVLVVMAQLGQHLAGFVTAVDDLRGPGLWRRASAIVVAAVAAGTAGYLAALLERFRSLAVDPVWEFLREEWGLPAFLAGLLVAVLTILVVTLVASLVGAAMLSIAFTIGPSTAVGRWLIKYSPVRYTRWVDSARISVVGFTASFPLAPDERATRWIYEGVRDSSGPLDPVFLGMLADDVARAVATLAPAGDRRTSVALRAVGDHEEVVLEQLPGGADGNGAGGNGAGNKGADGKGADGEGTDGEGTDGRSESRLLPDFPEAAALRRIRLALHDVEAGLPSVVRCSAQDGELEIGYWDKDPKWSFAAEEPEWFTEPGHEDLVREVVRYPPGAPWVRARLGLPAVELDW